MQKALLIVAIALVTSWLPSTAYADGSTLFSDPLQTNLSQWGPVGLASSGPPGNSGSAVITADPLGDGNALTFGKTTYQGDIVTLNSFTSPTGLFTLSFD